MSGPVTPSDAEEGAAAKRYGDAILADWAARHHATKQITDDDEYLAISHTMQADWDSSDMEHPLIAAARDCAERQRECTEQAGHWADQRARTLAALQASGWSLARIADAVGLTRSRVQALVERGRNVNNNNTVKEAES